MYKIFFVFFLIGSITIQAQKKTSAEFYKSGLEYFEKRKFDKAIDLFKKSITLKYERNRSYYNLAYCYVALEDYDNALLYVDSALTVLPRDTRLYVLKGVINIQLAQYDTAIKYLDRAISKDVYNMEAYHHKGIIYALFNNLDSACINFNESKNAIKQSEEFYIKYCYKNEDKEFKDTNNVVFLNVESSDPTYGFKASNPIKVGTGPFGGVANENRYFSMLRDINGKKVEYERVGRCCGFARGLNEIGYIDKIDITFTNKKGKQDVETIFITYYQYELPKILKGFKSVSLK